MTTRTALALAVILAPSLVLAQEAARPAAPASAETFAVLHTSRGRIGVKLLPGVAPQAVKNFVELATGRKAWTDPATGARVEKPLYDGTLFHRVIPGFMIQGGDPLTRGAALGKAAAASGQPFGTGGPGHRFPDEIDKDARPFLVPCQLAMANSGPDTNGSQFFVTEVATPHLNPRACGNARSGTCGYVHFGTGVCGCERVRAIATAGNSQTRLDRVVITGERPSCQ
jgi:peptidylprolyl isomerase/peptidyl-prolyl cis-trans isomerase A (cyclophilin A)